MKPDRFGCCWWCLAALVVAGAAACSGTQTPTDSGTPVDEDQVNPDGPKFCLSSSECPDGLKCREGVCVSVKTCSCNSECDKQKSEVCNAATSECETGAPPATCESACACYTGETCTGNHCVPIGGDELVCTVDGECQETETCKDGRCVVKSCTVREDCQSGGCLVCQGSECVAEPMNCTGDKDCCVGRRCNFGQCIPEVTGCRSDADCVDPDYPRCTDTNGDNVKECVQECLDKIDCPLPGQECVDNHCITPGCTPEQCALGQWCDSGSGDCLPGCDANDDCTLPQTCNYSDHTCKNVVDCCGGCAADKYCETLTCQCLPKCGDASGCPVNYTCHTDVGKCWCSAAACPVPTTCNDTTGSCEEPNVECTDDAQCPQYYKCNLTTSKCEAAGGRLEGEFCLVSTNCDQAAGLVCNNNMFMGIANTACSGGLYRCYFKCSLFKVGQVCDASPTMNCQYCQFFSGVCVPPAAP